jgi:hypothetical protein
LDSYVTSLLNSELPFDAWIVALTWLVLFLANHWIARSAREANQSQKLVAVEDWSFLRRSSEPKYILAQFLFAGVVFSFGVFLGGPAFVFFAGGLLVAIALHAEPECPGAPVCALDGGSRRRKGNGYPVQRLRVSTGGLSRRRWRDCLHSDGHGCRASGLVGRRIASCRDGAGLFAESAERARGPDPSLNRDVPRLTSGRVP